MSERLGGKLDLLWVAPTRHDDELETHRNINDLHRLAAVFGAELIVERDRDIAHAITRVAKRSGATHVVMGMPHLRQRLGLRRPSLVDKIVADDPTLQLALVGDPQPTPTTPH